MIWNHYMQHNVPLQCEGNNACRFHVFFHIYFTFPSESDSCFIYMYKLLFLCAAVLQMIQTS